VQIMAKHGLFLPGRDLLQKALELLKPHMREADIDHLEKTEQLLAFLGQRVAAALGEEGLPYDIIQAIENQRSGNVWEIMLKARALQEYRGLPGFELLLSGFTRAANLLRSAAQKGDIESTAALPPPRTELLREAAEKKLFEHIEEISSLVGGYLHTRHYRKALERLAGLSGDIDAFFDAVMVMDQDKALRHNRLALLQRIVALAEEMGDLSKLVEK